MALLKREWYPGADTTSQRFSSIYPGSGLTGRVDGVVLHTMEVNGWPSYGGGASAPNMSIVWDVPNKVGKIRQHFEASRSARALTGSVDGVSTNRNHVFQIELGGTSGWQNAPVAGRSPLPPVLTAPTFEDWQLEVIAGVLRWLRDDWGVPMVAPKPFLPWDKAYTRMSNAEWLAFKGICGHQHVPANDHSDPGAINITRIFQLVNNSITDTTITDSTEDIIMAITSAQRAEFKALMDDYAQTPTGELMVNPWLATFGKNADGSPRLAMRAIQDTIDNAVAAGIAVGVEKALANLKAGGAL